MTDKEFQDLVARKRAARKSKLVKPSRESHMFDKELARYQIARLGNRSKLPIMG